MTTTSVPDVTAAGRSDIAHHLHPYTQLRQLEQDGPLVIVMGVARGIARSSAPRIH